MGKKEEFKEGEWVKGLDVWGNVVKGYVIHYMKNWGKVSVANVLPDYKTEVVQCYSCDIEKLPMFLTTQDRKDLHELALQVKDFEWCKHISTLTEK